MVRDEILATLRRNSGPLRAAGVAHLALFGSVARGEETSASDVDLIAEFSDGVSLIDFVRLQTMLENLLGWRVDLVESRALKSRIRSTALMDRLDAF